MLGYLFPISIGLVLFPVPGNLFPCFPFKHHLVNSGFEGMNLTYVILPGYIHRAKVFYVPPITVWRNPKPIGYQRVWCMLQLRLFLLKTKNFLIVVILIMAVLCTNAVARNTDATFAEHIVDDEVDLSPMIG